MSFGEGESYWEIEILKKHQKKHFLSYKIYTIMKFLQKTILTILIVCTSIAVSFFSFAYDLTPQDSILVNKLTERIETIIEEKWEQFRNKIIDVLKLYSWKYENKKPRHSSIFDKIAQQLQENILSNLGSDAVRVEVDPVQCLGNAWEKDWIQQQIRQWDWFEKKEYPRWHILGIEEVEKDRVFPS